MTLHTKQHWEGDHLREEGPSYGVLRLAVPGGWLYEDRYGSESARTFVPDPTASHVRDARRLKLREGWKPSGDEFMHHWGPDVTGPPHYATGISFVCSARLWTARHADGSETDHPSRLEAHDALLASGSESPFVAVTGQAVKS